MTGRAYEPRAERESERKTRRRRGSRGAIGTAMTKVQANNAVWALRKWERRRVRAKGTHIRGVGYIGVALFEYLARQCRVVGDKSYGEIAAILGHSRSAVVEAAERLRRHGWIDWLRRWEMNPDRDGIEQIRNLFWVRLPAAALKVLGIHLGCPPPVDEEARAAELKERFKAKLDTARADALVYGSRRFSQETG